VAGGNLFKQQIINLPVVVERAEISVYLKNVSLSAQN